MFQITVRNFSSVVSDADVSKYVSALQKQVDQDFAPNWGVNARLNLKPKVLPNEWLLGIYDNADQAGALGYHDVTADGQPLGKVFAATTLIDGGSVSVTMSHELLEMLADPWVNLTAADASGLRFYAYEVCDAVEDDSLGYLIDGVLLSDFVLPNWFEPNALSVGERSFRNNVQKAFELTPGGYISYLDVSSPRGWQQLFGGSLKPSEGLALAYRSRGHVGSRREKRTIPIEKRLRSVAT